MRAFVTGVTGMIGQHFAAALRRAGYDVVGIARSSASSRMEAIPDPAIRRCDMQDRDGLETELLRAKPDVIVHMAAQAFNGQSWQCEYFTHQTNLFSTLNLLNLTQRHFPQARVLLACSSAEYGPIPPEECPLKEHRLLQPVSPYGISKAVTEMLGFQYFSNHGMRVYLPRLFIHVGTGHPPATAIQNFARQLALIKAGRLPPVMKVGTLDTARDFIDVRDGVAGMMLVLEKGQPGEPINICTGEAVNIGQILAMLMDIAGVQVKVEQDPALLRPSDEPLLLGDNSRLTALGWKRQYTIRQTLEAVFEDWMSRI